MNKPPKKSLDYTVNYTVHCLKDLSCFNYSYKKKKDQKEETTFI